MHGSSFEGNCRIMLEKLAKGFIDGSAKQRFRSKTPNVL
jgi:hypothetical protein